MRSLLLRADEFLLRMTTLREAVRSAGIGVADAHDLVLATERQD
jgi:hypothetical protein